MIRLAICSVAMAALAYGQYTLQPGGAPPQELAPEVAAQLEGTGKKIVAADGKTYCEIWFVKQAPTGPPSDETEMMWKTAPMGSLMGAIKYDVQGQDRRGTQIKPGVYTLRYSLYPINGAHVGVSPNRDFFVMSPAAIDRDPKPVSSFEDLMNYSRKASGSQHPAVLSIWIVESDFEPGLNEMDEKDWVLQTKIGDKQVAMIVIGVGEL
jgi:hypothetical protein